MECNLPCDRRCFVAFSSPSILCERVMRDMRAAKQEPDVMTWSTLMNAHAGKGDADACERVMRDMRAAKQEPDVMTWNTLMNADGVYAIDGDTIVLACVVRRAAADTAATNADVYSGDDIDADIDFRLTAVLLSECLNAHVMLLSCAGCERSLLELIPRSRCSAVVVVLKACADAAMSCAPPCR